MIYSLKSNSWRKIPGMSFIFGADHQTGMLLGDDLHWVVGRHRVLPTPTASVIVAFNLGTEGFREVPRPDLSGSKKRHLPSALEQLEIDYQ
ncbi:F-box family protein [Euphorbia peplus]|nr:F-box family protein [Euphorbia peplus]